MLSVTDIADKLEQLDACYDAIKFVRSHEDVLTLWKDTARQPSYLGWLVNNMMVPGKTRGKLNVLLIERKRALEAIYNPRFSYDFNSPLSYEIERALRAVDEFFFKAVYESISLEEIIDAISPLF